MENTTVAPPTAPLFVWPKWLGIAFATATTVATALTLAAVGTSAPNLALSAVILGVAWIGCLVKGHPGITFAGDIVLIAAATLLASDPGSEVLFIVCVECAAIAIEVPIAMSGTVIALAVVGVIVRALSVGHPFQPIEYFPWPIGYVASWTGGMFVRSQMRLNAELRAAQATVAMQAASDERRRLAREIHDVIAHSMTVTMLHVSGARLALQDEPPSVADAVDALEEAERQGRASLADVRRTVGLLASGEREESQLAPPVPGAADIAGLVASFTDAGAEVACHIDADLDALSPATGLGLYRLVQESVANAVKHAPGAPVDVQVRLYRGLLGGPTVEVKVRNPVVESARRQPGGGRGVPGMTERVKSLGGRMRSGPVAGGDWEVCARMPVAGC